MKTTAILLTLMTSLVLAVANYSALAASPKVIILSQPKIPAKLR